MINTNLIEGERLSSQPNDEVLPSSFLPQSIDPQDHLLSQNFFTKEQLFSQPDFQVLTTKESLYFGAVHNGLRHGLGVLITPHSLY